MTRRGWLLAAVGAAAGAAGLAWRQRQEDGDTLPALWQARFDRPEGGELVMASLLGRPVLLNFWGSWCPPCVKEMPELDQLQRQWSAGRVVGLAVDNPRAVLEFLAKHPVSYTIGLAGFDGAALSRQLGNSQGSLPFTVLFDHRGRIVQRKLGPASLHEWLAWIHAL